MTYFVNAATTTAVTVVPSARAFSTAACHRASGIRMERGMTATSVSDHGTCGDTVRSLSLRNGDALLADVAGDARAPQSRRRWGGAGVMVALQTHRGERPAGAALGSGGDPCRRHVDTMTRVVDTVNPPDRRTRHE